MGSAVINATSDRIDLSAGPAYDATTIAFWTKIDVGTADFTPVNLMMLRTSGYAYYLATKITLGDNSTSGCIVSLSGGGFTQVDGTEDFDFFSDEWLYVAMTSAGAVSNGAKFYVWTADGTLQKFLQGTPTGSGTVDLLSIGRWDGSASNGKYAYGRVWGRVLSQANLEAEMFSPTIADATSIYSAFEDDPSVDVSGQSHPFSLTSIDIDSGDTPPVILGSSISKSLGLLLRGCG